MRCLLVARTGNDDQLLYEGFDYSRDGTNPESGLIGRNRGLGFTGPWLPSYPNPDGSAMPPFGVHEQGLSYSRNVIPSGRFGAVQFRPANCVADESAGWATLTVTREGGKGGSASVNDATESGTAASGADFTPAGGPLFWADGESAPKTAMCRSCATLRRRATRRSMSA